jgi:hypothetical protein
MGAAYDLFGNNKTSIKVNYSKYLQAANNDAQYTIANPDVTADDEPVLDRLERQLRRRLRVDEQGRRGQPADGR